MDKIVKEVESVIEEIAKKNLGISTLQSRKSDELDFYNLAVWQIQLALKRAYLAGLKKGKNEDTIL